MTTRGRGIRFTAVLALVVLALTGFSRHGHSSRHGSGSGGGGCSSSHSDHDTSSSSSSSSSSGGGSYDTSGGSSYGSDDDGSSGYSGTGGGYTRRPTHRVTSSPSGSGTGSALKDGTARLISCASDKRPYATVEITNPNSREAYFQAWVTFYDDAGSSLLVNSSSEVSVPAHGKATARVTVGDDLLASVDHCQADREADLRP
ncbi:hypothetical protein [Streptomyces sp. NPDC002520]